MKRDLFSGNRWIVSGLIFGLWMIVFLQFLFPLAVGDEIVYDNLWFNIPWWLLIGLGWGFFMKRNKIKKNRDLND